MNGIAPTPGPLLPLSAPPGPPAMPAHVFLAMVRGGEHACGPAPLSCEETRRLTIAVTDRRAPRAGPPARLGASAAACPAAIPHRPDRRQAAGAPLRRCRACGSAPHGRAGS